MAIDVRGKKFVVGQLVAKGVSLNSAGSCAVVVVTITKIIGDKVYADNSNTPFKFPDRLAIIEEPHAPAERYLRIQLS